MSMQKTYDENCVLVLEAMVFDRISFIRKGFKSEKEPDFSFQVSSGKKNNDEIYRVTLVMQVKKEKEYEIEISLSGYFSVNTSAIEDNTDVMEVVNKNTVAILMPYIRSELTLLTAQPDMECVVMPPVNINAMLEQSNKED